MNSFSEIKSWDHHWALLRTQEGIPSSEILSGEETSEIRMILFLSKN